MNSRSIPAARRLQAAWALLCLCVFALLLPAVAMAQGAPHQLTASDRAEIAHFTLNQSVLDRLAAVTREGKAMHIKKSQMDMSKVHSLDDMADQLVAIDPRIKPLLAKHDFTPHQFVVANMALVGTAMAVHMQSDPKMAKYVDSSKLNQANLKFYKAHEDQIIKMMQSGSAGNAKP